MRIREGPVRPAAARRRPERAPPGSLRSRDERAAAGKALRKTAPRPSHAGWQAPSNRPDPIRVLIASCRGRSPALIPIRYGRMIQSPFRFFRGAAALMAADLADTPSAGIRVQACGDCHLSNFGAFPSPERRLVFDITDFDETCPAPFEWDVKRLATSFVIASRDNGHAASDARAAALACVRSYRERMAEFAGMHALEVWYARIELETLLTMLQRDESRKLLGRGIAKVRARNFMQEDFPKIQQRRGGAHAIKDNPPLIYHFADTRTAERGVRAAFERYRSSLQVDRGLLLARYAIKDIAAKVVGVGSVGTVCGIVLLMADDDDPLFLQLKEARTSVLEPYAGKSDYTHPGQRVVTGQRIMQSVSDPFLGWTESDGRHFYVRQLRDMKMKPRVEIWKPKTMVEYAGFCGWALARAHARAGDAATMSGYLGRSDAFDEAIADFAEAYARQNEQDHRALVAAVRSGRVAAQRER